MCAGFLRGESVPASDLADGGGGSSTGSRSLSVTQRSSRAQLDQALADGLLSVAEADPSYRIPIISEQELVEPPG